ncbi:MAG: AAA family ATPase [Kistimonas sp.]|nr:AAA family ATPase [Kistimonas sp.]
MEAAVAPPSVHRQLLGLRQTLRARIIGQNTLVDRLLMALLADGHILVEGPPGLAKTKAIKELACGLDAGFQRIQFTPDLLPSDITGTEIYRPEDGSFLFQKGPVFQNLVLADEINRAPAKVQAALLEAMAERQVSVAGATHRLPDLFLVMATQNPLEQEGTYPLPEAQLDRFLMHVRITYPAAQDERRILQLVRDQEKSASPPPRETTQQPVIFRAQRQLLHLHMEPVVEEYIVNIVDATRHPGRYHKAMHACIDYGASPRGTIALDRCARAHAWLAGRSFVTPGDVQAVVKDVLRHRISPSYEAQAQGLDPDRLLDQLLLQVATG